MLSKSLQGVRVLDFTRLYPGPLCTLMLADLGASVIKVEAPGGEMGRWMPPLIEDSSATFLQLNRNKRSLTLNLQTEQAGTIVKRLLERSDVLIESFRPGVMRRFLLDYESLRNQFPKLVYCSITGYGQTGKNAHRPGHDLNYISVAGIISFSGSPGKGYLIPPVQIADTMGAFQAITAILAALLQRNQTGAGQYLDISLLDGAFLMMILLAGISIAGKDPVSEQYLTGKLACYNLYRTSDDRYLALALLEPKFWNVFCTKLELLDLHGSQFQANQTELVQIISQKIASRSLQDWIEYFSDDDVCITPVQSIEEALQSEYVKQRQLFTIVENPFGSLQQMRTPFVNPGAMQKRAPGLGEHNREILKEAGYSGEEIDEFIRNKIV